MRVWIPRLFDALGVTPSTARLSFFFAHHVAQLGGLLTWTTAHKMQQNASLLSDPGLMTFYDPGSYCFGDY